MNIAIFINNISNNGGTEVVSKEYALNLLASGNTVHFVSVDFETYPIELENVVPIFALRKKNSPEILTEVQIKMALDYCKENKIERSVFVINVPHKYSPISNLNLIFKTLKFSKVEVVFHNSPKSYLKRYWNNEYGVIGNLLRKIKTKIQISPHAKKFVKILNKSNVKIFTLSHGCQMEMRNYYNVLSEIRYNPYIFIEKKFTIKKNIVTYCGRLSPEKNVFLLLRAWKIAKTDGWKLRLIGDGAQRNFLEKFCGKNKLNNVEFLGSVLHSEIYSLMAESKILCLTSFNEGFPTVVTEAMNMGNAIITTKFDGLSDELLNDENCIVSKASARKYSQALNRLFSDDSLVKNMGKSAYDRCKEFYSSKEYLEAR